MNWERVLPLVAPSGDIGGDQQVSEAYGARWRKQLDSGLWALITRSFYATTSGMVECQTEFMVCDNPDDPGSTERWADYSHAYVAGRDPKWLAENAAEASDDEWAMFAPRWAEVTH